MLLSKWNIVISLQKNKINSENDKHESQKRTVVYFKEAGGQQVTRQTYLKFLDIYFKF